MRRRACLAAALALLALGCAPVALAAASVTVSPLPGSVAAPLRAQISFLGAPARELRGIAVVGSASGRHAGRLRGYASAPGASFVPARPFRPGEHVSVRATLVAGKRRTALSTSFTVARPVGASKAQPHTTPGSAAEEQHFFSQPGLHPPVVSIAEGFSEAPGYVLATPSLGPGQHGPMIFDNHGSLVWFRRLPAGENAADLQVQSYSGRHVLTWWQGRTNTLGYGAGEDVIADSHYRTLAVLRGGNGLRADGHEFLLTPHGQALVTASSPVIYSLASAGGPSAGVAIDCALQEIDVKTGLVMWEWHSLGHVDVSGSYASLSAAPPGQDPRAAPPYDYFHLDSVALLPEGNLLVSARNTQAVYEISHRSGALLWTLGGKHSSFTLGPGAQFAYQQDARLFAAGELSLFDAGVPLASLPPGSAPPGSPPPSGASPGSASPPSGSPAGPAPASLPARGEILHLDPKAKVAALVQSFVRTAEPLSTPGGGGPGGASSGGAGNGGVSSGGLSSGDGGNMQALPGGNRMTGWDGLPNFSEFNSFGATVFDGRFPAGETSYRVYRFPWYGQPDTAPSIAATTGPIPEPACRKPPPGQPACMIATPSGDQTTVYMSWNGATGVAAWRVLGGTRPKHLKALATVKRAGFETSATIAPQPYVQAQPLGGSGKPLATTRVARPQRTG